LPDLECAQEPEELLQRMSRMADGVDAHLCWHSVAQPLKQRVGEAPQPTLITSVRGAGDDG
jgi:hypothetical protein